MAGAAPCLQDDLAAALRLRPFAEIMTVNGACTVVEHAAHMLAGHTNKAELFAEARRKAFPGVSIRIHANWPRPDKGFPKAKYPSVTDWWDGSVSSGATSAGKAARIGLRMGFDEIILCGCPLDGSGYVKGEAVVPHDCHRVGDPAKQDRRAIASYKRRMAMLAEAEFKGRVFSMSGYTRELLGAPT